MSEVKRHPVQGVSGVEGYMVDAFYFDAERLRAETAVAEAAALREELASANADKAAYAQNAIDLRTSLDAVKLNLSRADDLISTRTADLLACGTRRKAAEQRNSELVELLRRVPQTPDHLWHSSGLSADIAAALQPTESGASE